MQDHQGIPVLCVFEASCLSKDYGGEKRDEEEEREERGGGQDVELLGFVVRGEGGGDEGGG